MSLKNEDYLISVQKFASEKHKLQKYGKHDYMYHVNMVAEMVKSVVKTDTIDAVNLIAAAYCHDLIEDQGVTAEELSKRYGKEVSNMVIALSGEGTNRKERTADTVRKLNIEKKAIDIKIVDRFCNMYCARQEQNLKLMKLYYSETKDYEDVFKNALPEFQEKMRAEIIEYENFFNKPKNNKALIKI